MCRLSFLIKKVRFSVISQLLFSPFCLYRLFLTSLIITVHGLITVCLRHVLLNFYFQCNIPIVFVDVVRFDSSQFVPPDPQWPR